MLTVVEFHKMSPHARATNNHKNDIYTRDLRKIAFIDNKYPRDGSVPFPQGKEHWLVEILRENQNANGGCFVLKPLKKVDPDELSPLVHGMYTVERDEDALVLFPKEQDRFWIMSPTAKKSLQKSYGEDQLIRSFVISHGGDMWSRRPPAESLMERKAKQLLQEIE